MWHRKDKVKLSESFLGWLMGEDKSTHGMSQETRTIEVRLRIIQTLKEAGLAEGAALLNHVARAPAMEDLWYLRPNIMQALSSLHGETHARRIMTSLITPLFVGSVPTHLLTPRSAGGARYASR
jgi:hypothetical protein